KLPAAACMGRTGWPAIRCSKRWWRGVAPAPRCAGRMRRRRRPYAGSTSMPPPRLPTWHGCVAGCRRRWAPSARARSCAGPWSGCRPIPAWPPVGRAGWRDDCSRRPWPGPTAWARTFAAMRSARRQPRLARQSMPIAVDRTDPRRRMLAAPGQVEVLHDLAHALGLRVQAQAADLQGPQLRQFRAHVDDLVALDLDAVDAQEGLALAGA